MIAKAKRRQGGGDTVELRPDGWERFNRAVNAAAKSGPKHRTAKKRGSRLALRHAKNGNA